MKKYLVCTGLVLSLFNPKNADSMELDMQKVTQLLKTHAGQQFLDQVLEQIKTARLDEEDSLDGISPIEKSLHFVPVEQQKTLSAGDIIADTVNDPNCKKHKIFSINFNGIEACTSQLESIVHRREELYNLRSISLTGFDGVNNFARAFFSNTDDSGTSISSSLFPSLSRIDISTGDHLAIDNNSLKSILDHFSQYNEVVRDMVQYNARTGAPVASIQIEGVDDELLAQTDLSSYVVQRENSCTKGTYSCIVSIR